VSASQVYDRSIVVDFRSFPTFTRAGMAALKKSGMSLVHTGVETVEDALTLRKEIEEFSDHVILVTKTEDVRRAKREGKTGVMVSIEHPDAIAEGCSDMEPVLRTHITIIEHFYQLGVRAIQPSYNRRTRFADGGTERTNGGLSWYGVELVEKMNELGMVVQPSHCGEQTTLDCIEVSKDPICISHSGCKAVYDHPRCKSDEVLRRLADKGGVMGVFILTFFVSPTPAQTTSDDIVAHIDHAVKVAGIESVGIGTDYGIYVPPSGINPEAYRNSRKFKYEAVKNPKYGHFVNEVNLQYPPVPSDMLHEKRLLTVAEKLEAKGYGDDAIEKILGANVMRVLQEVIG